MPTKNGILNPFAVLPDNEVQQIRKWEQQIHQETGKEIVLIAYEKSN